jgi:hypothetical protein
VPFEGTVEIPCGLQVFGNQRCVLVLMFDCFGHPLVQLRPIGLELRFVCHRAHERMTEGVLGIWRVADLVHQLGTNEVVDNRFNAQCLQQIHAEPRPDYRCSIEGPLGGGVQAVDAGGDGGL